MSYILEALKKLEQKRHQEEAPKALTFRGDLAKETKRKRSFWPYIVIALLVINGGLLSLWAGFWRSADTSRHQRSAEPRSAPHNTPSQVPVLSTPSVRQTTPSPGPPPKISEKTSEIQPQAPAGKTLSQPSARPSSPSKTEEAVPAKPARPRESSPSRPEPHAKVRTERKTAPDGRIHNVKDLPPDIRNGLPELKMSVHFFDTDPQGRFAIINNRTLKEGMAVTPGLKLETITATGVVLNAQGHRFLLRINENL